MYNFNFAGCENSEDLLQNGPTCQPGKMVTFFSFHCLIFRILETMLGDFRSGGNALSVSQVRSMHFFLIICAT
jgi:hypothetical protein